MFLSHYNMNGFLDSFFPVSFGTVSAGVFAFVTYNNVLSTIILASIGALVGYLMKKLLDWVFKRLKERKGKE